MVWYRSCPNKQNGVWDRSAKNVTYLKTASHPKLYCAKPFSKGISSPGRANTFIFKVRPNKNYQYLFYFATQSVVHLCRGEGLELSTEDLTNQAHRTSLRMRHNEEYCKTGAQQSCHKKQFSQQKLERTILRDTTFDEELRMINTRLQRVCTHWSCLGSKS